MPPNDTNITAPVVEKPKPPTVLNSKTAKIYKAVTITSVALWLIALPLPGLVAATGNHFALSGFNCFWEGALYLPFLLFGASIYTVAWLSNVVWFVWLRMARKNIKTGTNIQTQKKAAHTIMLAAAMSLTALIPTSIMFENENDSRTAHIGIGGIIWILSMIIPAIASWLLQARQVNDDTPTPTTSHN